ncbi:hypothetical protein [Arcobacter vandammei]|uniref:hypothetical protein n=1 Tax=Arcobacter vandammei TaxID=2782243 RepID=UPI0018E04248|nr:hypothetical protein [Arcobacter vandammei]
MKKIFISLIIIILLIILAIFGLFFTKYGNSFISTYIENRVNSEQDKVKLKVEKLNFTFKTFDFNASIDDNSYININGGFEILKKRVDLKYDIKINDLENIKNLINIDLKGAFFTNGTFIGDKNSSIINGVSNFASGETVYNINLVDFELDKILINSKNLKVEELLELLKEPIYSKGILNIDANINNFKTKNLSGNLKGNIEKGILNNEVINKELNQTLSSNISFDANINSDFSQNKVISNIDFKSSLLNLIFEKFELDLTNKNYFGNFQLLVKNLERLEGFTGKKLKGELESQGILKSENKNINISGSSNIIESKINYNLDMKNSSLSNLTFNIEGAKIEKLLKLLDEPVYAVGHFDAKGNIKNIKDLSGNTFVKFNNVKIINEVVNAVYNQNIKEQIVLNSKIDTKFEDNKAISKIEAISNVGNLNIDELVYNLKDENLFGKYIFVTSDLSKLKDFTKMELRGDIKLNGDIKTDKGRLFLDGKSTLAGGNFDFILNDNLLNANLRNSNMKSIMYLIKQKEKFDSNVDLSLNYNLLTKKGDLLGNFLNGHFLENDFTKLVGQFTKVDLTKEIYENSKLTTKIDDKLLTSNLIMQSPKSKLEIYNSKIDLEKNTIYARIDTQIKDNKFAVILENDLNNPTLSFDVKDILEKKLDKNIDKLGEKLNKVLGKDKSDESGKEILKGLKGLF